MRRFLEIWLVVTVAILLSFYTGVYLSENVERLEAENGELFGLLSDKAGTEEVSQSEKR